MDEKRRPLHPDLLAHIRGVLDLCLLAGCTNDEVITLTKKAVSDWKGPVLQ